MRRRLREEAPQCALEPLLVLDDLLPFRMVHVRLVHLEGKPLVVRHHLVGIGGKGAPVVSANRKLALIGVPAGHRVAPQVAHKQTASKSPGLEADHRHKHEQVRP